MPSVRPPITSSASSRRAARSAGTPSASATAGTAGFRHCRDRRGLGLRCRFAFGRRRDFGRSLGVRRRSVARGRGRRGRRRQVCHRGCTSSSRLCEHQRRELGERLHREGVATPNPTETPVLRRLSLRRGRRDSHPRPRSARPLRGQRRKDQPPPTLPLADADTLTDTETFAWMLSDALATPAS